MSLGVPVQVNEPIALLAIEKIDVPPLCSVASCTATWDAGPRTREGLSLYKCGYHNWLTSVGAAVACPCNQME